MNEAVVADVVPVCPEVMVVSGAVVSAGGGVAVLTVNARVAGVASVLPATSVARTETEWSPSLRAAVVHGLVQLAHAPVSTRHSKTEFASVAVKANVGVLSLVVPVGPEVIVVSGAVVSGGGAVPTVNERVAGDASVLPATSVARTETRVGAVAERGGRPRAGAVGPGAGVDAALEDRVRLGRGEGEASVCCRSSCRSDLR